MTTDARPDRRRLVLFLLLMVLVGLNLRPALSSLAPLLLRIRADTGLSPLAIGALTTLPVLCLGVFAPLAPWLAKRAGPENTLALALGLLILGLLLRGLPAVVLLFGGTLLVGAAIGVAGTLLPALVKRELPGGADLMTGVYTMALCLGGALGAGLSIPLADLMDSWRWSLVSWGLLAAVALLAWVSLMPRTPRNLPAPPPGGSMRELLGQPLAWQVMLLMGTQSSLAYIVFGWLPTLLQSRGYSEAEAGWLMGASVMVQLISALGAPWLARFGRDQRPALLLVLGCVAGGLWLLLQAGQNWRWPGVVLLGLGQGGSFSLALTLIVLRTANSRLAGKLSGLAQGGGYTLAAMGPLAVGVLLQFEVSIDAITIVLLLIVAVAITFALLAGRNRRLDLDQSGRLFTR
ncbi:MFS transporter [Halomonas sp. MCCC 1A17488]|uniref:MFS transporter n=1 Tax=unclassified Halomonas TaxID=2609666 RepID=UPI0018D21A34|nr:MULTISPECIES: MFS transporter [unclassified Halomonas]MCE8015304.1 MFS transporter [Halomonas sp. MCCC 1A17488]MCG3238637.1 MFS transporter [Halomonas sp. MCCC 1A17488]QPP51387.1 MFS transporter [Halomonas sp. SS10-MC5]